MLAEMRHLSCKPPMVGIEAVPAIRHCSFLTSRRTTDQSIPVHNAASSLGAPAEVVFCFPILEGRQLSRHGTPPDVGTLFPRAVAGSGFRAESICRLYPPRYRAT